MKGLKDKKTGRFLRNLKDKDCLQCNIKFHPRFSTIKFCSKICESNSKKKDYSFNCIQCGNKFIRSRIQTRFCSHKCYGDSGVGARKASASHLWKGGITPIHRVIRTSAKYLRMVKSVLQRDNYKCTECPSVTRLHVHHIIAFAALLERIKFQFGTNNLAEEAFKSDFLWDTNNCKTLCEECHKKTDSYLNYNAKHYGI